MTQTSGTNDMTWLIFSLVTVVCWGVYGILLHSGQLAMHDPVNGRYKAFLCVGIAYFLTAVLAPLALLVARGANWSYPLAGFSWSLLAGIVGALGALGVLMAFGARGVPAVVMSIVFAGAPVVNAVVALILHPPQGGFFRLPLPFVIGLIMAALGGCLVTLYRPGAPPAKPPVPVERQASLDSQ